MVAKTSLIANGKWPCFRLDSKPFSPFIVRFLCSSRASSYWYGRRQHCRWWKRCWGWMWWWSPSSSQWCAPLIFPSPFSLFPADKSVVVPFTSNFTRKTFLTRFLPAFKLQTRKLDQSNLLFNAFQISKKSIFLYIILASGGTNQKWFSISRKLYFLLFLSYLPSFVVLLNVEIIQFIYYVKRQLNTYKRKNNKHECRKSKIGIVRWNFFDIRFFEFSSFFPFPVSNFRRSKIFSLQFPFPIFLFFLIFWISDNF